MKLERMRNVAPKMYELLKVVFNNDVDEDYWKQIEDILEYVDGYWEVEAC